MARLQKHLLMLLEEFDALCAESGAHYSIIDRTLLYAEQAKPLKGCEVDVVMLLSDFQHFSNRFAEVGAENRIIEAMDNNPLMPGWYYRFVDTSTTLLSFDYAHVRRFHGVGVNIHIARSGDVSPGLLLSSFVERGMKSGIHLSYKRFQMDKPFDPIAHAAVKVGRGLVGKEGFANLMSEVFRASALTDPKDEAKLLMPEVRAKKLPAGFLASTKRVTLNGTRVEASVLSDGYLSTRFGGVSASQFVPFVADSVSSVLHGEFSSIRTKYKSFQSAKRAWQRSDPPFRAEDDANLCSLDNGYGDLKDAIDVFLRDRSFWSARSKWLRNRIVSNGWRHYLMVRRWDALFFVMERYHQWERYAPYRDAIERLCKAEHYDLLQLYLRDYLKHIEEYARKGYPLAPDDWMWDVAKQVYKNMGNKAFVQKMDQLKKQDKLIPISGVEADRYLEEHPAMADEPIMILASAASKGSVPSNDVLMFVERANATGDMEALLLFCLSAEECRDCFFVYVISSVYEASDILKKAGKSCNRIRFVVQGGKEYYRYLKSAKVVFTTDLLPQSHIKREQQRIVFIPAPDYAWDGCRKYRSLLSGFTSTVNNADLLVLPNERVKKNVLLRQTKGRYCKAEVLTCMYPRYGKGGLAQQRRTKMGKLVFGAMLKEQYAAWSSFEDVSEFARMVAAETGVLSDDICVRIPQTVFEGLLKVDKPKDTIVSSYRSLVDCLDNAELVITDSVSDYAVAYFGGIPVILVSNNEMMVNELQADIDNSGVSTAHIVGTVQEAFELARTMQKEIGITSKFSHGETSSAREIVECALHLFDKEGRPAYRKSSYLANLLVLEWQDTDEFHEFLSYVREFDSAVVLLEKRTYELLISDIEALSGICACYVRQSFVNQVKGSYAELIFDAKWKQILGESHFGIALAPKNAGVFSEFINNVPAKEIVTYDNLSQLMSLLNKDWGVKAV